MTTETAAADDIECCACHMRQPKKAFSKAQLKKAAENRKCKACITSSNGSSPRNVIVEPVPSTETVEEEEPTLTAEEDTIANKPEDEAPAPTPKQQEPSGDKEDTTPKLKEEEEEEAQQKAKIQAAVEAEKLKLQAEAEERARLEKARQEEQEAEAARIKKEQEEAAARIQKDQEAAKEKAKKQAEALQRATEMKTANHVYIMDKDYAWIPARVLDITDDGATTALLNIPQYKDEQSIQSDGGRSAKKFEKRSIDLTQYPNAALPLQNVDQDGCLNVMEDMVDLPFLHEAAILYNLKARHLKGIPYTRTGDIVIAVNPFEWHMDLYAPVTRRKYAKALVWERNGDDDPRKQLPPHVYEASCLAYRGLASEGEDQSILVSGESGAGKTETVKILMGDIASVQQGPRGNIMESADQSTIVQRVLDSNPLLEAFGNAKTLRNDNSSRFGKYIQLQFDGADTTNLAALSARSVPPCKLVGSKCEVYLLEKSRVVSHVEEERTFHIFYQLLAAPEETKKEIWEGLADTDNESFEYVGWSETDTIEGKTDQERFQLTIESLKLIGVTGGTLTMLMRTLCIVLQLGNLEFAAVDDDSSKIADQDEFEALVKLTGIGENDLRTALLLRNMEARSETFQVPLSAEFAKDSADAFAKEIYAKTFLWLVRTINDATCAEKNYEKKSSGFGIIGLLDIFGFETFEVNRFEQLCINYANEKLQAKFTSDIFQSVMAEYEFEGIELGEIVYDDNSNVLDLVEGRMGLLAFLNEECVRPKGADKTFVYKAKSMNQDNPCLFPVPRAHECEFGIKHYAGPVVYDATGMVAKNMDTLPSDLQDCAKLSDNLILSQELTNEDMMNPLTTPKGPTKKKKRATKGPSANPKNYNRRSSNIVAQTVWSKFKDQLSSLMSRLGETRTRYIRCIKPNQQKAPLLLEHNSTVEQLRCAGVVAAVTISRSAFPNRLDHEIVLDRFRSMWPKGEHIQKSVDDDIENKTRKAAELLLNFALKKMEFEKDGVKMRAFVMGRSRAYFRAGALEFLEGERLKYLGKWAASIQKVVRRFVAMAKYRKARMLALRFQALWRMKIARKQFLATKKAAIKIQCLHRVRNAGKTIYLLRRTFKATIIQTRWRIHVDRRRLMKFVSASIIAQAMIRGALQRPKYRQALIDKKEEAKLENQLKILQRKLEEAETRRLEAEKQAEEKAAAAVKKHEEEKAAAAAAAAAKAEEEKKSAEKVMESDPEKPKSPPKRVDPEDTTARAGDVPDQVQLSAEQQALMDESGKMLEYLRKEVFKLRSQNSQLKTDFDLLKDNNQRLMDANASAGASFAALNQHAKQMAKQNSKLQEDLNVAKTQVQKLNLLQIELKEELKMKKATYVAEVHSRLQHQKAIQKISDLVQRKSRDHRLVEKVLQIADECEFDYDQYAEEDATEGEQEESSPSAALGESSRSSIFGFIPFFS